MRKPLLIAPLLQKQLGELQKSERADALLALLEFTRAFGQPTRMEVLAFAS